MRRIVIVMFFSMLYVLGQIYSEEEAELYRMPIKPITPKDGIWTGHVIAYGHYIKRPYKFEIREDTLIFVNNVRIYPPLISKISSKRNRELKERAQEKGKLAKPYMERFHTLINIAREVYREVSLKKNRNVAIDSLYRIFKNDTLLQKILVDISIEPTDENDATMCIKLRYPGYGGPKNFPSIIIIEFYLYPPESLRPKYKNKEEEISTRKQYLVEWIKDYQEELGHNNFLIISSFRGVPLPFRKREWDTFEDLLMILSSSKSKEEINERLKNLSLIDDLIKEILYNYNSKEWPPLDSIIKR